MITTLYFIALLLMLLVICFMVIRQQKLKRQTQRSTRLVQNPYRNLPLDNQKYYEHKPKSAPGLRRESIPDSIDPRQLEKLRKRKSSKSIAIRREVPHEVLLVVRDQSVANRLFSKVAELNPGESEEWCWSKVVWDVERDRH